MLAEKLMGLEQATISCLAASPQMNQTTDHAWVPSWFHTERALLFLLLW